MITKGDVVDVELIRVTAENKGVALLPNGALLIVENVEEDDSYIRVQVTQVLEESVLGMKMGNIKTESKSDRVSDSPYDVDNEGEEDDE